ncbi:transposase [Hydrogenophaga sp.]|uniref:transposase n=1 Tax=Hydrogenophaga sp. TaxID=1904254 RepID=UPI003D9ABC34
MLRRWAVLSERTALLRSLQGFEGSITAQVQVLEAGFTALLQVIEARIVVLLEQEARSRECQRLMQSIVGVGPLRSALLRNVLAQLNFFAADALVAYSGLDPRARDSGSGRGRRRLSTLGQLALRHQTCLTAILACHTSTFKRAHKALCARGLKTTEAPVALARKLLRIAFAVWHSGLPFDCTHSVSAA